MPSLDHNIPISLSIFTVNQLALFWTEKFTPLQVTHELPEWFRRILLKVASHACGTALLLARALKRSAMDSADRSGLNMHPLPRILTAKSSISGNHPMPPVRNKFLAFIAPSACYFICRGRT
jgi:hypothetical protein